jgi:hypothetical protein
MFVDAAPVVRLRGHRGPWSKLMGTYERIIPGAGTAATTRQFALRLSRPFAHPFGLVRAGARAGCVRRLLYLLVYVLLFMTAYITNYIIMLNVDDII